jgi:hypothetical protein
MDQTEPPPDIEPIGFLKSGALTQQFVGIGPNLGARLHSRFICDMGKAQRYME